MRVIRRLIMPAALFLATAVACAAVPPAIFYSDLASGPATGGPDGQGAFVTIAGRGFGDSRGSSTVTVGGVAADRYPVWQKDRIAFQLPSGSRSGVIRVVTPAGSSNGVPFSVRPGRIFFVDDNGPSEPGSGTHDDPWRSPESYFREMRPGDICYFREGEYRGVYGNKDRPYNVSFHDAGRGGEPGSEIAWVGYPGERASFIAEKSPAGNFEIDGSRRHIVVAGLSMYSRGDGRGAVRIFADNVRLANCRIDGVKTLSYGMIEVKAGAGTRIWGNNLFGAESGNKLDHILYCQAGSGDVDFGWNYVHDNDIGVGPVISIHEDGGHSRGTVFRNIRIHDNLIDCRGSSDALRVLGTGDAALGGSVYVYNNLIREAGSTQNYYHPVYLNSCSVYLNHNTFYRFSGNRSYAVYIDDNGDDWHPETVEIRNNIFYNQSTCGYIGRKPGRARVTIDSNCYFGGEGRIPPADRHPVTADPRFINGYAGDLHLSAESSCIGRAHDSGGEVTRDYDGILRLPGGSDMGAYQRVRPGYRPEPEASVYGEPLQPEAAAVSSGTMAPADLPAGRDIVRAARGSPALISFSGPEGDYSCRVFSLAGELVWSDRKRGVSAGVFEWDPGDAGPGMYAARITGPGLKKKQYIAVIR